MGIQETKEIVGFVLSTVEAIDGLFVDGVSFADVGAFIEAGKRAPAALKDVALALPELKDLSDAEKAELKSFIVSDFDIPQDNIESAIETALCLAVDLSGLLNLLQAKS